MPIFKNHRGQFHGMNTALVAVTSLYVIGAAVALSSPYWASSYPALAPLAAFAATPLGVGILTFVAFALIGLAIYAISKNNKVSEKKAPKLVKRDGQGQAMLLVTRDVFEEMKENNKIEDERGKVVEDKHYIEFSLNNKDYRVIIGNQPTEELGNTLLFKIDSLEVKGANGKYTRANREISEELGLNKEGAKEVHTYLGELSSIQSAVSHGKGK